MNFGKWIVVAFLIFAGIIISMVVVSMRQDVSLVAADYYQQEVKYQSRINEIANAKGTGISAKVVSNPEQRNLSVSIEALGGGATGSVVMFRPSDARLDRSYHFDENGKLSIDTSTLKKGLWKMKISWEHNGRSYFEEKTIVL